MMPKRPWLTVSWARVSIVPGLDENAQNKSKSRLESTRQIKLCKFIIILVVIPSSSSVQSFSSPSGYHICDHGQRTSDNVRWTCEYRARNVSVERIRKNIHNRNCVTLRILYCQARSGLWAHPPENGIKIVHMAFKRSSHSSIFKMVWGCSHITSAKNGGS